MGVFSTSKQFAASPDLIEGVAKEVMAAFQQEGFEVKGESMLGGGYDISVTKGNLFKAVLGLRTALKVTLAPRNGMVEAEAGVGIFGQQAIPTVISMFFLWPVLLTQIWGMVEQSQLDEKALGLVEQGLARPAGAKAVPGDGAGATDAVNPAAGNPCVCGAIYVPGGKYCTTCGKRAGAV